MFSEKYFWLILKLMLLRQNGPYSRAKYFRYRARSTTLIFVNWIRLRHGKIFSRPRKVHSRGLVSFSGGPIRSIVRSGGPRSKKFWRRYNFNQIRHFRINQTVRVTGRLFGLTILNMRLADHNSYKSGNSKA